MSLLESPREEVPPHVATVGGRLTAVDAVRGLVMVLMVLDHTRDFFGDARVDATNPATSTLPLFFTRWVTHFCAPLFVFLAGSSAYLRGALGKRQGRDDLAWFLVSRGLFLVLLELTVVRLGLFFSWTLGGMFLQVIWVIGLSMVLLAAVTAAGLSPRWVGLIGAVIVLGHNVLDLFPTTAAMGRGGFDRPVSPWWFALLFRRGLIQFTDGIAWFVAYPLLPWFGIMALGYAFGPILLRDRGERVRLTAAIGLAASVAFVLIRALSVYGDPQPFQVQEGPARTLMAFLNCQKYPPSLLYALMTLGPGLLLLAGLDATEGAIAVHGRRAGGLRRFLVMLGRVPLFYYLLQWPLLHVLAVVVNRMAGQGVPWTSTPFDGSLPVHDLPFVYAMTALTVAILAIPCRWYARLKLRRKEWTWLSYL
ncbi:MAG: heparan-alpha-glucosaminide N-acetyltransferase domain-containing protein [Isosphaeraceae bacterium]